ncbi:MAG: glycoside hydrolase family 2 TIM barrel-domain containing protein [Thermoleophilaceae bacterium]
MPALLAFLVLLVLAVPAAARAPDEEALYADGPDGLHLLDRGWTTRADTRDVGRRRHWERAGNDRGFRRVSVPHSFNARDDSTRGFRSRVQWYRVRFDRPRDRDAEDWRLRFESVNRHATVWLNGRRLGTHEGAYLPFEMGARGLKQRGNELVVRVDGRETRTDLPPSSRPRGWWNHGGILREVYLRRVAALDLADLQVIARRGSPAQVEVEGMVRNATGATRRLEVERAVLAGPDGTRTNVTGAFDDGRRLGRGRLGRLRGSFSIPDPREWSPDAPNLYRLDVRLAGGQLTTVRFGIREWAVNEQGQATLNGRPLSLRGASFHEETLNRGGALRPREHEQIVAQLQAVGADFTRAHYPPHPALLEAFDRAGIVFWEQIPVWRLRDTNFSARLRKEALSRLREAILRDRNHAAIMTWSVANETLRGGRRERAYITDAVRLIRRLDPTRLAAADPALRPLDHIPAHYDMLDAIGVNEYVGWYGGATPELRGDLEVLRARFPRQALFVTEFGAEANRSGPATELGTFEFQTGYLGDHLAIIDATSALSGALVWALRDFWVRPRWSGGNPQPDSPFNRKGIFDERGNPKPAFETVRQRFAAVPPLR